ncbi:DNA adenine methylase, partial [Ruegeria sp. PrR005]
LCRLFAILCPPFPIHNGGPIQMGHFSAARFLYLQRTAFGGKVSGRNFGVSPDWPARFNLTTLEPMLEDVHARLSGVVIECLPYGEFLARYDRPGALFYMDPPYWGCENDYGKAMFAPEDFEHLADFMGAAEGKVLMSINDVPQIRELFAGFQITEVSTSYTVARKASDLGKRRELLVANFDI